MSSSLWQTLEELKKKKWVDLTHPLDNASPYWDGMPDGVLSLADVAVPYESMNLCIQTFTFPGQMGTHIDYPAHFIPSGRLAGDFDLKETVLPLVVIDLSEKVKNNPDYEITVQDILDFETLNGRIPKDAFVAMRTDWSQRWPDAKALANADAAGNEHFPGWTIDVLKFLYDQRAVAATGHETLDTDAAVTSTAVGDLQAERFVLARNKFQLEAMAHLNEVPATGSLIVIAAPHIVEANGLPVRAWAILP